MGPRNQNFRYICLLILSGVIVCTLFIWYNSNMSAVASSGLSRRVLAHLKPVLDYFQIPASIQHRLIRKAGHVAEYVLLGALWTAFLLNIRPRRVFSRLLAVGGLCLLTALVDETIQLFSPGRGGMILDVWLDLAGACLGILAAAAIRGLYRAVRRAWSSSAHGRG